MSVIPNTEVRLLSNVPLINSYEHQMTFNSTLAQANYFLGKSVHQFFDFTYQRQDQTIHVPKDRDSLYNCNYVMFKNNHFSGKWFYGFITKLEYINPNMTKVHFELDVYQTWQFDIEFKPSYVEREHARRWNADGTPVIHTVEEGLNYGSDYEVKEIKQYIPYETIAFLVVVAKAAMHNGAKAKENKITPSINGVPQPLSYYILPFRYGGGSVPVKVGTTDVNNPNVEDFLRSLYSQERAQNNIVSIYVTEYFGQNVNYDGSTVIFNPTYEIARIADNTGTNLNIEMVYAGSLPSYNTLVADMGDKYSGYSPVTESKLFMHPYTVLELVDGKGNKTTLKNEYINGKNIHLLTKGSLGTSNKTAYYVKNYLHQEMENEQIIDLETALINNDPNDIPVADDFLAAYLQGNKNSIQQQKETIGWNMLMGAISSSAGGSFGATAAVTGIGSSFLEIQAINAKLKDIANTPPQLQSMGSNSNFDFGNSIKGCYLVKKQITAEYRKKLSDFFKMYGYKINELKIPNLKSRQHFNFIKTIGANITGNVPQDDINVIKNMFNTGVTLWHGDWVGDYSRANNEV